jgi:hypothetical protein
MWAHIINFAIGIWLMFAPATLNYDGVAARNDYIVGPLIASFAMISWWGATRAWGRVNALLGVWLMVTPWVLNYDVTGAIVNSVATGAIVTILAPVRGHIRHAFAGGWPSLWRDRGLEVVQRTSTTASTRG